MGFKTDIQIAQQATLKPITAIAESLGITTDELEMYGKYNMGATAENVAEAMGITREEQDAFAL